MLIDIKNGFGREVNPYKRTCSGINDPNYLPTLNKWEEFEQSVKSYPAPNCEDEQEVEAELVWQVMDNEACWNNRLFEPDNFTKLHHETRQIYRLTSPKEEKMKPLTTEQIVEQTILHTLHDLYFLDQLRESESHIVRNQLIAERKKVIFNKLLFGTI